MDSLTALEKVYDSLSLGASTLDFSPSEVIGDCAEPIKEIVRQRISGHINEEAIKSAMICLDNGNGLVYLGLISAWSGHWNCAINAYEKALIISEKLGDVHGAAQTYNNLGSVYDDMGEWSKAIEYYQKSLETKEKLGDVHGKGITLSNLGKMHLDAGQIDKARKYLEDCIGLINKEARPDYPNVLNWLALCYNKLGNQKKREAKKDFKNQDELVVSSSFFFSKSSELYDDVGGLPRVRLPSLLMYAHFNKGLSFSVKNIIEQNDRNAIILLDNALNELRESLKFADENEKTRLKGVICDHEAKRYIRLAAIETKSEEQNRMLDKAIEALKSAALNFERYGDECSSTCEGCMHLFQGLKFFRNGINEYVQSKRNKILSESVFELMEARKCYEKAGNELGADTIEALKRSFKLVEEQIKSKDEILVTKITPEFINIIEELSSVGLRKMVKIYTFDEGMNVKKEESGEGKGNVKIDISGRSGDLKVITNTGRDSHIGAVPAKETEKNESVVDILVNPATLASFIGWGAGGVLMYMEYNEYGILSVIIGCLAFVFFVIPKFKRK